MTVADSPPVASVRLNPLNPSASQVITATATTSDLDGDPVTLSYIWFDNGTVVQSDLNETSLTDTYDLGSPGHGGSGDLITVQVVPSDGTLYGAAVTASTSVAGTAPSATVSLAPASPTTDQTLTATATTFDFDNQPVTLTYVWTRNGQVIQTTANTSSLTDTLNLATQGFGGKGNVIAVQVTPSAEGMTGAVASSSVTIVDSPPSASVALSPIDPMVASTLTATVTSSDADNDPLTYTYVWEQNGTVVQTTTDTSSAPTHSTWPT